MSDFVDFRMRAERLGALARARASETQETDDDATVVEHRDLASVEDKRRRLAGLSCAADAVDLVIRSAGCPIVPTHAGSVAAAQAVRRWVLDFDPVLLILGGGTGRGKTVAATWAAAVTDATWWLDARTVRVSDDWSAAYRRACRAKHLIVDDLGVEKNQWASDELASIIEHRTDRRQKTLVTTNLPPRADAGKSLLANYGDRFFSRLAQRPKAEYVAVSGHDLRRL